MPPTQHAPIQPPTLHLLCGKLGSGKSTLARRLAEAPGTVLISEDLWLSTLYPEEIRTLEDYLRCSARLRDLVGRHTLALLAAGLHVVLDFPGNTLRFRAWGKSLVDASGAAHVLHVLEASDETCLRQMHHRNANLPEGSRVVTEAEFHAITAHFQPPTAEEGFIIQRHEVPPA